VLARCAGVFFAAGFFVVPAPVAFVRALAGGCAAGFFFPAGLRVVVTAAPDATRDECLVRCLVVFFVTAASAIDDIVKAAIRATRISLIVLPAMRRPLEQIVLTDLDGCRATITRSLMDSLSDIRLAIYDAVVGAREPSAAAISESVGLDKIIVTDAFRALAEAHVIVLEPGTADIAWAPPFSVVPTSFRVGSGGASWYAPCAWDAFGIAAALKRDVNIDARCAWSGETIACGVASGRAFGDAVIHLLVPAAHFWDDIGFT
jgi:hypothetical protein